MSTCQNTAGKQAVAACSAVEPGRGLARVPPAASARRGKRVHWSQGQLRDWVGRTCNAQQRPPHLMLHPILFFTRRSSGRPASVQSNACLRSSPAPPQTGSGRARRRASKGHAHAHTSHALPRRLQLWPASACVSPPAPHQSPARRRRTCWAGCHRTGCSEGRGGPPMQHGPIECSCSPWRHQHQQRCGITAMSCPPPHSPMVRQLQLAIENVELGGAGGAVGLCHILALVKQVREGVPLRPRILSLHPTAGSGGGSAGSTGAGVAPGSRCNAVCRRRRRAGCNVSGRLTMLSGPSCGCVSTLLELMASTLTPLPWYSRASCVMAGLRCTTNGQ